MLRSCITNSRTFQHGYPVHLRAIRKTSRLNDTSYSYGPYFLDFVDEKIRTKMSDFILPSIKTIKKKQNKKKTKNKKNIRHPFCFLLCCSALVYTGIIKCCIKLGMMPTQANVKMTSAHMSDKVSRKLIFKWHERFQEDRESLLCLRGLLEGGFSRITTL